MTDELVERLRTSWDTQRSIMLQTDAWMSERHLAADRIEVLTAERDRLREALKPFAFFFDDDGEAKTTQQAWEIIYRDRVEDWVFYHEIVAARAALKYQEIVAARAALKGETP